MAHSGAEAIRRSHGKNQRLRIAVLMFLDELGKFLRAHFFSAAVEENQPESRVPRHPLYLVKQCSFIGESERVHLCVGGKALEVFSAERLDGPIFGLANPRDL